MNDSYSVAPNMEFSEGEESVNSSLILSAEEEEQWKYLLHISRYTVQRILVPIVLIIGTVGNGVTIAVMTRRHMQSSTTLYLTALAVSDMLYLFVTFSLSIIHNPGMSHEDNWFYMEYFRYALWITDASSTTSIWLTVTFTIERYIAVCHPIKGKILCTHSRAKRLVIGVYLLFFILTITTPHEWVVVPDPARNGTLMLQNSDLGKNVTYRNVFYWFSALVLIVLPLCLLAAFNTLLILAVKRSRKQRTIMTGPTLCRDSHSAQENKITIMLIAVVLLAFSCQLPTAVMLMYTSFHKTADHTAEYYIHTILNNFFNLLTAVNAAANFIFYCALSDKYRRTFMKTFCKRWQKRHSPPPSWMATTAYTNFEDGSPRTSLRGSQRHSRTSSYRSSLSSNPRASPSQTALRVLERHHGSPYLTVPPRGCISSTLTEEEEPTVSAKFSCSSTGHPSTPRSCYLRQTFRNGGSNETYIDNTNIGSDSDEPQDPSSELFDESLKISLDSASAVPELYGRKSAKKLPLSHYIANLRSKTDPKTSSKLIDGKHIMITYQNPSLDDQTAV